MTRLLALLCCLGCRPAAPPALEFDVEVSAADDSGEPVANLDAEIGPMLLRTGATGTASARLTGRDGQQLGVRVTPPPGARLLTSPRDVTLQVSAPIRGGVALPHPVRLNLVVAPEKRTYVVAVLAEAGDSPLQGLPVLVLDERVGATDSAGVAHVVYQAAPGSDLRVRLDTSHAPRLHPADPTEVFRLPDRDAAFAIRRRFDVAAADRAAPSAPTRRVTHGPRRPATPKRRGPTRF